MRNYENYALGKWTKGDGEGTPLYNAITAEEIGRALYQELPEECRTLMKECSPLSAIEENRRK